MIVCSHMFRGHSLTYECSHQAVVLAEKLLGPTPGTGPERGVGLRTWRGLKKITFWTYTNVCPGQTFGPSILVGYIIMYRALNIFTDRAQAIWHSLMSATFPSRIVCPNTLDRVRHQPKEHNIPYPKLTEAETSLICIDPAPEITGPIRSGSVREIYIILARML